MAKGVRRVTAVTGQRAVETSQEMADVLDDLAGRFNCSVGRTAEARRGAAGGSEEAPEAAQEGRRPRDLNAAADKLLADAREVRGAKLIVGELPGAPVDTMRAQIDRLRQKAGSVAHRPGMEERRRLSRAGGRGVGGSGEDAASSRMT